MSEILTKIQSTADILGGTVFFANDNGYDPEYPGVELVPNGMYIRLEGSDGSIAYISAHEIDKAIGIIGQMSMSKASQADVDAIIELLDDTVSKLDLELVKSDIDNKVNINDFNNLSGVVANKADKTDITSINNALTDKADKTDITSINNALTDKADKTDITSINNALTAKTVEIENLKKDIKVIEDAMNSVSGVESIEALQNQLNALNSELNKKLTSSDLTGLKTSINNLTEKDSEHDSRFNSIESNLNKKASTVYVQGQVNELNNAITGISIRVDSKADKDTVAKKASKSDLDSLTSKVTKLNNDFNGTKTEFEALNSTINNELNKKASVESVNAKFEELQESLSNKVENSNHISDINRITTKLTEVENNSNNKYTSIASEFESFEDETNNSLAELRSSVNNQLRQIEEHEEQITNLQDTDYEIEEKLKMEWVKVMTPEEYKNLPTDPYYGDGSINPYAKQPNVIYMLVRYNKPIAVYIGDVLIAQAEQKGSVGFAYSFPISF